MSISQITIGKRIALTVASMVILFIAMALTALFSLNRIEVAMNGFSTSVEEGHEVAQIEESVIELMSLSSEYLASFDQDIHNKLVTQSREVEHAIQAGLESTTDKNRKDILESLEQKHDAYNLAESDISDEKASLDYVYENEINVRLEKFISEMRISMDSASEQGDVSTSFQASFALQNLFEGQAALVEFLLSADLAKSEKSLQTFEKASAQLKEIVAAQEDTASFDESLVDMNELAVLQKLVRENESYSMHFESLVESTLKIQSIKSERLDLIVPQVKADIRKLEKSISAYQSSLKEISRNTQESSKMTLGSLGVFGFFLCSGIGFLVIRSISKNIEEVAGVLQISSRETNNASGQVMDSSKLLAEGASEQAASLEETSASLEEMASMTRNNAESAEEAKNLAAQTRSAAEVGAGDMEEMTEAMNAIKDSSDNIAKIIRTIDEIAFQTNLLALNAAVEAARAGEAGMGFAVVADEVRNLAHRSAEAARETAVKIEDSLSKSERGFEISQKVAKSLTDIVERARDVDGLVVQIARSSQEQSTGIDQIGKAVNEIDSRTQENASTAEETSSASFVLNDQALNLEAALDKLLKLVGIKNDNIENLSAAPSSAVKNNFFVKQNNLANQNFEDFSGNSSLSPQGAESSSDLTFHGTGNSRLTSNNDKFTFE